MLQIRSVHRLDQTAAGLRLAAARHSGSILSETRLNHDTTSFTVCLQKLQSPLLDAEPRFAAFLPCRVSARSQGDRVQLEAIAPRSFCRLLHRPELEYLTQPLEDTLRAIMEEAGRQSSHAAISAAAGHASTEDQVNMRGAVPQRIDCRGTKVEEMAGTGSPETLGG